MTDTNVRDEMANILKTLSPKEEKVIRLRFGIGRGREPGTCGRCSRRGKSSSAYSVIPLKQASR